MPVREIPERMQAAWIDQLGPAENIRYGELPVPAYGPTDVLVRVEAASVNPVDLFVRSGRYRTPLAFPFVVGRDLVGTVAARGPGASSFAVGARVWSNSLGHAGRQGTAAEYAAVSGDRLYPLPDGIDPVAAVAVLHPAATADLALTTHANLLAGETVFVGGGGGNVGAAAITLAALAGARVIASASVRDHEYCRALGAATVIDYRDPDLPGRVRESAPGGVDVHLDTSGRQNLEVAVDLLARRGRVILMAGLGEKPPFPVGPLYTRDGRVLGFAISNAGVAELAAAAARINALLASGSLRPRRTETLPLSAAAEAHRRVEAGQTGGARLVLVPDQARG